MFALFVKLSYDLKLRPVTGYIPQSTGKSVEMTYCCCACNVLFTFRHSTQSVLRLNLALFRQLRWPRQWTRVLRHQLAPIFRLREQLRRQQEPPRLRCTPVFFLFPERAKIAFFIAFLRCFFHTICSTASSKLSAASAVLA